METVSAHISVTSSRRRHVSKADLVRAEGLEQIPQKGIGKLAGGEAKRNHRNRHPKRKFRRPVGAKEPQSSRMLGDRCSPIYVGFPSPHGSHLSRLDKTKV